MKPSFGHSINAKYAITLIIKVFSKVTYSIEIVFNMNIQGKCNEELYCFSSPTSRENDTSISKYV